MASLLALKIILKDMDIAIPAVLQPYLISTIKSITILNERVIHSEITFLRNVTQKNR